MNGDAVTTIVVKPGCPSDAQVLRMLRESDAYYARLYPAESNHLLDVNSLLQPNISFLIVEDRGSLCGFGALVAMGSYGEVKRMYVAPPQRGRGAGRRLLSRIEDIAQTMGLASLRLETGIRQPEAIQLYRSQGFREIGPFGDYRLDPLSLFMEKDLVAPAEP